MGAGHGVVSLAESFLQPVCRLGAAMSFILGADIKALPSCQLAVTGIFHSWRYFSMDDLKGGKKPSLLAVRGGWCSCFNRKIFLVGIYWKKLIWLRRLHILLSCHTAENMNLWAVCPITLTGHIPLLVIFAPGKVCALQGDIWSLSNDKFLQSGLGWQRVLSIDCSKSHAGCFKPEISPASSAILMF